MGELTANRAQEELLISADSHVIELPDLWEKRLPRSFGERAPRVYFDERRESWMFGSADVLPQAVGGLFIAGPRPEEFGKVRKVGFSGGRPGGWDSVERVKDMVIDRGRGDVLYSSLGVGVLCVAGRRPRGGCVRV